ncbi:MAG: hypothetical protein J6R27_04295 [Muribaculaceae bacterium]|nr:hypothetical protein [Muribaculaceae bacterium]
MSKQNKQKVSPVKKGVRKVFDVIAGRWLSTNFFGKHWGVILAIVVLIMTYITSRYQCITAMETIKKLEYELQVVKSERIRERSYYMSGIRESAMQERIDNLGLGLQISQTPPYLLE